METETIQELKKRGRRKSGSKLETEQYSNSPTCNEQDVLPANNSDKFKVTDDIVNLMEAEFGNRTKENLLVIYDNSIKTFRPVELKINFENMNKGIRKMRLAIIRKKMNPNEYIVNEEIFLTVEFKISQ